MISSCSMTFSTIEPETKCNETHERKPTVISNSSPFSTTWSANRHLRQKTTAQRIEEMGDKQNTNSNLCVEDVLCTFPCFCIGRWQFQKTNKRADTKSRGGAGKGKKEKKKGKQKKSIQSNLTETEPPNSDQLRTLWLRTSEELLIFLNKLKCLNLLGCSFLCRHLLPFFCFFSSVRFAFILVLLLLSSPCSIV